MKRAINYFIANPKKLFLADGAGAMLTAILMHIIRINFIEYFQMPATLLINLSVIALTFSAYSMSCYFFLKRNGALFIRAIGYANLLYCSLAIGLLIHYYSVLTVIGIVYFLVEVVIICGLAYIELRVASGIKEKTRAQSKI